MISKYLSQHVDPGVLCLELVDEGDLLELLLLLVRFLANSFNVLDPLLLSLRKTRAKNQTFFYQCCGSGIRCLFDPLDPGSGISLFTDP
jgi:hypothetical protein